MKKLALALLLLPMFAHSQTPLSDRWKLLFEDKTTKTKTYVDTQTIEFLNYFDVQKNVCLCWAKTFSNFSNGTYHEQTDIHMAIALDAKQYGYKSYTDRKDGNVTKTNTFLIVQWNDIEPETNAELLLNYCKNLHK
ncbi:MAG TPA: hypothetical protein VG367_12775 [Mucilaginibacter sp.]|jgi:hypothetical protein|nr:hypothetical protein [Mucilaginibacter sp.]